VSAAIADIVSHTFPVMRKSPEPYVPGATIGCRYAELMGGELKKGKFTHVRYRFSLVKARRKLYRR
jgi:hypothetical protein